MSDETKAAVTVSEMARMVRLSRARFYQLVRAGIFPAPVYQNSRPVYVEEMQKVCLEVRRKNRGVNGEPVLFYARYKTSNSSTPKQQAATPGSKGKDKNITALLDGLNALGLTTATAAQVEAVTKELYPSGTVGLNQGEVLRAVFLEIRRRYSADNVGR